MRFGDPIDLAALKAAADSNAGPTAVVERTWLKRVLAELTEGRTAQERLGTVFASGLSKI